jgi:hypothetical protein
MPPLKASQSEILEAALIGLELRRDEIERKMAEIRSLLEKTTRPAARSRGATARTMSAAVRRRIAAAQRKRWANIRKSKKAAEAVPAKSQSKGRIRAKKKKPSKPSSASSATVEAQSTE